MITTNFASEFFLYFGCISKTPSPLEISYEFAIALQVYWLKTEWR
jgi:hypothetical protein